MESPTDLDRVLGVRDVVVVEGPDAQTYLHSQLSQDLNGIEVGDSRWTFVLEPNGKVEILARVTRVGDECYELDTDEGFGDALLARIDRFKIRVAADTSLADPRASRPTRPAEWRSAGREWGRRSHRGRQFRRAPA